MSEHLDKGKCHHVHETYLLQSNLSRPEAVLVGAIGLFHHPAFPARHLSHCIHPAEPLDQLILQLTEACEAVHADSSSCSLMSQPLHEGRLADCRKLISLLVHCPGE